MRSHWKHLLWVLPLLVVVYFGRRAASPPTPASPPVEAISDDEQFERGLKGLLKGDTSVAVEALKAISADKRSLPLRQLLNGGIALRTGRVQSALESLSAIEPVPRLERPMLLFVGEALYRLDRHAEAELCFRQLMTEDPNDAEAHRWLGAIYYDLGTVQPAIRQIEQVVRLDPNDYRPHHLLGVIYSDIEDFTLAEEHFRAALDRNPPTAVRVELTRSLAQTLVKVGNYSSAIQTLETASGQIDAIHDATIRAQCAYGLSEFEQAQRLADGILARDPDNLEALRISARLKHDQQQWPAAITLLQRLLAAAPADYESRYLLAIAYARSGNETESQTQMKRYETFLQLKTEASELYAEADLHPTDAGLRDRLADVCEQLGQPKLATMWRRAAQTLRSRRAIQGKQEGSNGRLIP